MAIKRNSDGTFAKGTEPPNPKGRPKDGESWAAIIKAVGDMYPEDIVAFVGKNNDLGRMLSKLPKEVQMKYLVVSRVFSSLMFEPSSGLWKELMERAEGKVADKFDINSNGTTKVIIEYADVEDTNTETAQSADADQEEPKEV